MKKGQMNVFVVGSNDKKSRIFGKGISQIDAIIRTDKILEIIPRSKVEKSILGLIEAKIEVPGYFVCIKLKSESRSGNYLHLLQRIIENKKVKKISVATYNLDKVDSHEMGNTIRDAIMDHQSKVNMG